MFRPLGRSPCFPSFANCRSTTNAATNAASLAASPTTIFADRAIDPRSARHAADGAPALALRTRSAQARSRRIPQSGAVGCAAVSCGEPRQGGSTLSATQSKKSKEARDAASVVGVRCARDGGGGGWRSATASGRGRQLRLYRHLHARRPGRRFGQGALRGHLRRQGRPGDGQARSRSDRQIRQSLVPGVVPRSEVPVRDQRGR